MLETTSRVHGGEAGVTFSELVDIEAIRDMMEDFYAATGFVVGIVDRDGRIVVQVGYRDICTRFHRACPATEKRCIESDLHIGSRVERGTYVDYTCANGLIDAASPIVIDGDHLATIYTGQFFFEPPDEGFFRAQAEAYGFDWEEYRGALWQVPVVTRTQYDAVMGFLTRFAQLLAQLGLQAKRQRQAEAALRQADKMEAVGRLAGGVAHDLNNMLQVILGHCDLAKLLLQRGDDPSASLDEVMDAGARAHALVTQLLAFGRRAEVSRRLLDARVVVANLLRLLGRLIGSHIRIDLDVTAPVPPVLADPAQLEQVVMNLCVNARDAMPEGGRIGVRVSTAAMDPSREREHPSVEAPAGLVAIEISDTGLGIPAGDFDRIFEPFYTTKGVGGGTGLGLATVYAVAEQHGGFVEVESEVGSGSRFRVLLPARAEQLPVGDPDLAASTSWEGGGETVLFAEDERSVRDLTRGILESAGYRVLAAADGAEAIELFEEHASDIDLLVLDVIMPVKNGRQVYEAARRLRPGIPVLFCSAYTQDLLEDEYTLRLPSGQLLQKPYAPRTLLDAVRGLLDGPGSPGQGI